MATYRKITDTVEAEQWRQAGDLAGDKPLVRGEGRIVKNYVREDVPETAPCAFCSQPMHAHGWIDPPAAEAPDVAGVDPVTGKPVPVLVTPPPAYPKTYTKSGAPDRIVNNQEEEAKAFDDGFKAVKVKPAAAAPPAKPVIDKERGDLNGLVVCPGDWVVTHQTGERETVKPSQFERIYTRVTTMVAG